MKSRVPWLTLVGGALVLALAASPVWSTALELDRAAVMRGEYWRLLTGHFAHWTSDHLAWDVAAFLLAGAIVERESRWRFVATVLGAAFTIGLAMLLFLPELARYRGLSGVDAALFVVAGAALFSRARAARATVASIVILAGGLALTAKLVAEFVSGHTFVVAASPTFVSVPLAHVVGAGVGVLLSILRRAPRRVASRGEQAVDLVHRQLDRGVEVRARGVREQTCAQLSPHRIEDRVV